MVQEYAKYHHGEYDAERRRFVPVNLIETVKSFERKGKAHGFGSSRLKHPTNGLGVHRSQDERGPLGTPAARRRWISAWM